MTTTTSNPEPPTRQSPGTPTAGVIAFVATSLLLLLFGCLLMAIRPEFLLSPKLGPGGQAWVDLMLLGAGLSGVYGAVTWAIPSVFRIPLYSGKFVALTYAFHLAGLLIVVASPLVAGLPQASMGRTFLACGALVFLVNVSVALRSLARPDAASGFLSSMLVWLVIALFFGTPFAGTAPLPALDGTMWSAGWIVFFVSGVLLTTAMALALRAVPPLLGCPPVRSNTAWFALAICSFGVAWTAAATTFGPPAFIMLCATVFLAGSLIYLWEFWSILQRRPSGDLPWEVRILLTAVCLIPASAAALLFAAWMHSAVPAEPQVEGALPAPPAGEVVGVAAVPVVPDDLAAGLTAVLAAALPALLAVLFILSRLARPATTDAKGGEGLAAKLAPQVLLASFFNYATGAGLAVLGVWAGSEKILGLGALFLLVGTGGFLAHFLHSLSRPMTSMAAPAGGGGKPVLAG